MKLPQIFEVYPDGGKNKNYEISVSSFIRNFVRKGLAQACNKISGECYLYCISSWRDFSISNTPAYVKTPAKPWIYTKIYLCDGDRYIKYHLRKYLRSLSEYINHKKKFVIKEDKGKVVMFLDDEYYQNDCKDKLNSLKSDIDKYNEAKKTYKPNIETIERRRNIGTPNEGVLTSRGWFTGD